MGVSWLATVLGMLLSNYLFKGLIATVLVFAAAELGKRFEPNSVTPLSYQNAGMQPIDSDAIEPLKVILSSLPPATTAERTQPARRPPIAAPETPDPAPPPLPGPVPKEPEPSRTRLPAPDARTAVKQPPNLSSARPSDGADGNGSTDLPPPPQPAPRTPRISLPERPLQQPTLRGGDAPSAPPPDRSAEATGGEAGTGRAPSRIATGEEGPSDRSSGSGRGSSFGGSVSLTGLRSCSGFATAHSAAADALAAKGEGKVSLTCTYAGRTYTVLNVGDRFGYSVLIQLSSSGNLGDQCQELRQLTQCLGR